MNSTNVGQSKDWDYEMPIDEYWKIEIPDGAISECATLGQSSIHPIKVLKHKELHTLLLKHLNMCMQDTNC